MERLSITGNAIANYEQFFGKLNNLNELKDLTLDYTNLQNKDTLYLSNIKTVQNLSLRGTYVDNLNFLIELPNLKTVSLPYGVSELSVIYQLPYLESLNFDGFREWHVDNELTEFLDNNNIWFPDFNREIAQ